MSTLKAQQLLYKVSSLMELQKETFSHEEIVKKVNQIKYLATQKKTPRFILQKEIQSLEGELKDMLDLERSLNKSRQQESTNVKLLKKKIELLKKRLAIAEDKELPKKVEKLSHLLGEMLAKCGTAEEVENVKKLLSEVSPKKVSRRRIAGPKPALVVPSPAPKRLTDEDRVKIKIMQDRLIALKHELEMNKILKKKNNLQDIEKSILLLENKINKMLTDYAEPEIVSTPALEVSADLTSKDIKHDILFSNMPVMATENTLTMGENLTVPVTPPSFTITSDSQLEAELPLPPPPRIKG